MTEFTVLAVAIIAMLAIVAYVATRRIHRDFTARMVALDHATRDGCTNSEYALPEAEAFYQFLTK